MANVSYLKPQERQNVGLTPVSLLSSLRKTTETLKAPEVKMAEASYLREQEKKKLSQDINQSTKRTVSQVLNFGKDVLQGIARSGGSVGMTLATPVIGTKELAIDTKAPVWQQKLQKIVFGTEPVKTIQTRIAESEQELKTKGLPIVRGKSIVGGKAALPLSILGVGASTILDFTGAGGEKNAIKLLAKTNKVEGVVNILKKMKVADNLIPDISKQIAKTTDEKVVKNILSNLNNKTGMVSPFSRLTQDLKTEKGFLATNIDGKNKFFVSERDANNFAKVSAEKLIPEAKASGQSLNTVEDVKMIINEGTQKYGSKNAYLASEEYKNIYPRIQEIYKPVKESFLAKAESDFQKLGVSIGDKVERTGVQPFGGVETFSGVVAKTKDGYVVKLDSPQMTQTGLRKTVPLNENWKSKVSDTTSSIKSAKQSGQSFDEWVKGQTYFRGQDYEGELGAFYTMNKKEASNYGNKVFEAIVDPKDIYKPKVLPKPTSMQIDNAITEAQKGGYKALLLDEGTERPTSLYIFDKRAIKTRSQLKAEWDKIVKVSAEKSLPEATLPKAIPKSIAEIPQKSPLQLASKIPEIDEELSSLQKITNALKEAKPIRKAQEALYTKERGAKMAKAITVSERGESGFYKELGALKGELPKVEFESLRNKVSQVDVDNLFNQVKDSQVLNFWDKISTRGAVAKMLEGRVPTERELYLLNRVFPKELVDTILSKRDLFTKFKEAGYQLANVPRSVMASFDLSAPFRQGLFLMSHPKRFFGSFLNMFKSLGGENAFKAGQEAIARKSTFDLMDEGKLALTEMDTILTAREERFASQWAEKIPIVGKAIRASGRAYTGFLNKLRADVFDDLIVKADKIGLMPRSNPDLVKQVANFVNVASGRGSLGSLQPAANALNAFFFSPRLMASRLTLLNPLYYIKADPFVRKEALKSLFTFAGVTTTVLGLAKLGGAEVGYDPRSADFGKIKIGNTRIDIMGGTQQYIRMAAQLITGKYISTTTGKEITLGEGYKPLTRLDILVRQVESKEAPIFSFITDLMRGQDYAGNKIKISKEIGSRFVPMLASDIYDIAKDDPSLLPVGVLGGLGFSVQTYAPQIKFSQPILNEIKRLQTLKLGQTSGLAGYMPEYEGVKDNKALHKNAEEIVNKKIEKLLVVPAYKNLTDEEKAKKISQFVDKAKIDARAQMVLKLTKDLKGQDLKNKLSELKKGGLMTEEVYNKFLELRTAQ